MLTAEEVIALLQLVPLPIEGGFFRRTYTAADAVRAEALPERYGGARKLCSAIYYLLGPNDFSALHRLRTDEIYHFYLGDPVELLMLHLDGSHSLHTLGTDLAAGQQVQLVVPRGVWQGSRLRADGGVALMGTTMAPAYQREDFELGARDELAAHYPACAALIAALTYDE
ncbi:MAG: cupin domain-containing protein [Chloroflexi bacterium SZAS-1]|nr:cupin domain-containing protein [Chloroflexi bacterium SZAS-1]